MRPYFQPLVAVVVAGVLAPFASNPADWLRTVVIAVAVVLLLMLGEFFLKYVRLHRIRPDLLRASGTRSVGLLCLSFAVVIVGACTESIEYIAEENPVVHGSLVGTAVAVFLGFFWVSDFLRNINGLLSQATATYRD